ncbi:hypothetical protein Nepgr_011619 [Nepenthes gracilis]|uniref:Uncharacterized protein n=1 Tax=Nepenthes gracilis TaxID=150966 RepID=A0AAD3XM37_NEPGR|nr:hypothetical protein Nepgr_011619 [Nepenthes gracilis]
MLPATGPSSLPYYLPDRRFPVSLQASLAPLLAFCSFASRCPVWSPPRWILLSSPAASAWLPCQHSIPLVCRLRRRYFAGGSIDRQITEVIEKDDLVNGTTTKGERQLGLESDRSSCLIHSPHRELRPQPDQQFTGFCPSCLCERLAVLDQSSSASISSGHKSTAAPKSILELSTKAAASTTNNNNTAANVPKLRNKSSSFFHELRRAKSLSCDKNEGLGFSGICEPQRKSCDVRVRNTLWSLFHQNDQNCGMPSSSSYSDVTAARVQIPKDEQFGHLNDEEDEEEEEIVDEEAKDDEIEVLEEPISSSNNINPKYSGGGEQAGEILVD